MWGLRNWWEGIPGSVEGGTLLTRDKILVKEDLSKFWPVWKFLLVPRGSLSGVSFFCFPQSFFFFNFSYAGICLRSLAGNLIVIFVRMHMFFFCVECFLKKGKIISLWHCWMANQVLPSFLKQTTAICKIWNFSQELVANYVKEI